MLVQKMALNVDVGFILSFGDFVPTDSSRLLDVSQNLMPCTIACSHNQDR